MYLRCEDPRAAEGSISNRDKETAKSDAGEASVSHNYSVL
jgi:hypothetical protein